MNERATSASGAVRTEDRSGAASAEPAKQIEPPAAAQSVRQGDHVVLIDGSGYIFRAYHGLPALSRKSDGLPVGAVHGFCQMLWKLLRDRVTGEKPTHLAVIFDAARANFGNDIYADYKAHRPEAPDDLIPQFPLIRDAVRAFCVACVEQDGYEADDLIATYARQAREAGASVTIIGTDKDLMQLVHDGITMFDPVKEKRIGREEVIERFGVPPEKVVDIQALAGDSTDNVPGVPGIGVKTAAQLIGEYGDLETLLARAGEIKQAKRRESLLANADQARLSRRLVMLDEDVPLAVPLGELAVCQPDPARLLGFLREMEFNQLTRRIAEAYGIDVSSLPPPERKPAPPAEPSGEGSATADGGAPAADGRAVPMQATPATLAAERAREALAASFDHKAYETVTDLDNLDAWIAEAAERGIVAFDTETDALDAVSANLVGVSLATGPGRACYIPLGHRPAEGLAFEAPADLRQTPLDEAVARLKVLLEDPSVLKIGQNAKYDILVLSRYGITVSPFDDTMLLSYVLDAGKGGHGMDELSERWLGHKPISFKDVAGTGRAKITFDLVPLDRATAYSAEDADVTFRLHMTLKPRLAAEGLVGVYETLERPLVPVLTRMEAKGVAIDRAVLSRLSGEFAQVMVRVEEEIYELVGERFNLASPKQLGDILFDRMKLPGGTRTPTGAWATRANMLEELAEQGHELPAKILEWRQLAKLKSTYTDALPGFVKPETGRVHTSFSLAATTTGRLASSDPNLQNIPIRTEEGRKIRRGFVPAPGYKLVSADYSQIELRLLAHMAEIPQLQRAFAEGLDIHAMTAAEMFGVPINGMDPQMRRRAKTINFGIIYGISAFGLASRLGIPQGEARDYIARYFERFPGIRDYIEATKAYCREHLYVTTLFGRKCHYPNIRVSNANERAFNERAAINAPIQGTAADIIRRAMIRMEPALAARRLGARMLLQVHDELVFEVPEEEVDDALPIIRRIMCDAPHPAVQLKVPLEVDAKAADNWEEAH